MKTNDSFLNRIRWAARISGTLLVTFTLVFGILVFIDQLKEKTGPPQHALSTIIIIVFIIWGIALAALILALWKEGLGGWISFLAFFTVGIVNCFNPEAPNKGKTLIMFAVWMIPSLLYIFYWWRYKNLPKITDNIEH